MENNSSESFSKKKISNNEFNSFDISSNRKFTKKSKNQKIKICLGFIKRLSPKNS